MKTLISLIMLLSTISTAQAQSVEQVMKDIAVLTESSDVEKYRTASVAIVKYSKQYKVEYRYVLALIMTESSFNQKAVSNTGDYGIGQINYKIWSKEFERLKKKPLDHKRLKTDVEYAIHRTVEILAFLKCQKDPHWVAKYHSKTPSLKKAYFQRIQNQLQKIASKSKKEVLIANK